MSCTTGYYSKLGITPLILHPCNHNLSIKTNLAIVKQVLDVGSTFCVPDTPQSSFNPDALCKALGDMLTAKAAEHGLMFSDLAFGWGFTIMALSP